MRLNPSGKVLGGFFMTRNNLKTSELSTLIWLDSYYTVLVFDNVFDLYKNVRSCYNVRNIFLIKSIRGFVKC